MTDQTKNAKQKADEQQIKAVADKAAQDSINLEKASLAHVTAKVADGPEAGVQPGQVATQANLQADTAIAHAAATSNARPDVVAAFRDGIRSKILELAVEVETKIREVLRQKETPSQIVKENVERQQSDREVLRKRKDLELFAAFSRQSGSNVA